MAIDFTSDVEVIDIVVPGETQVLTVEVAGMQGPPGALTVGNVITSEPGTSASITVRTLANGTQVADFTIPRGSLGPSNTLTIGTVAGGATAAATITGTSPNQTLNLTLPKGDKGDRGDIGSAGPANVLTIGTVSTLAPGSNAAASLTGAAPNQTLNLSIPQGATGLKGDTGATGPVNTLSIGTVTTGASGGVAAATITGAAPNQTLNLTLPRGSQGIQGIQGVKGDKGDTGTTGSAGPSNTITIGSVGTGAAGSSASATITGASPNQTLNLVIPQGIQGVQGVQGIQGLKGDKGDKGDQGDTGPAGQGIAIAGSVATYAGLPTNLTASDSGKGYLVNADGKLYIWSGSSFPPNGQGTAFQGPAGPATSLSVSSTTTSLPGTNATVSVSGTAPNQSLAFTIPRGAVGATGPANTLTIGTITTGTAGSAADASITGTAPNQTLNLTIPQGLRGLQGIQGIQGNTGPANTLAVGTVTTGAAGTNASATITGTAPNQTLSLTIPQGQQGIQGIQGTKGDKGDTGNTGLTGPANTLSIGTVNTGAPGTSASAAITGSSPNQTLSLTIPAGAKGDKGDVGDSGPANSITIGTVTTVTPDVPASATITGSAPNQTLNLAIPRGLQGAQGAGAPDASFSVKGLIRLTGDLGGTADSPTVPGLANKANLNHTHTAANITDATPFGRTLLTVPDEDAARTVIGAGTSDLVIGTTAGTAAAGNDPRLSDARTPVDHTHVSTDIEDSTFIGRDLLAAVDAEAARAAIGAGTGNSDLVIGTTATTAMAGNKTFTAAEVGAATPAYVDAIGTDASTVHTVARRNQYGGFTVGYLAIDGAPSQSYEATRKDYVDTQVATRAATSHTHTAANISDSTTIGRTIITSTDAAAVRTAIGAGTSSLVIGTTSTTAMAGNKTFTAAEVGAAPASHTHTAANISDSTTVGRTLITAASATAARTAIGARPDLLFTANKTGAYAVQPNEIAVMVVNGGGNTLTLPAAPADGTLCGFHAIGASQNALLTINRSGSDTIGTGNATSVAEPLNGVTRIYEYQSAYTRWIPVQDVKPLNQLDARFAPITHTHTSANITDATATGVAVITAASAAAARTAIGAGTGNSNLVIGTTAGTAAAGNDSRLSDARTPLAHTHSITDLTATGSRNSSTFLRGDNTWATITTGISSVASTDITDSTATGRSVLTAADAAAARTAIGAGTSNLTIGTTGTTAAAGNDSRLSDARTPLAHTHTAANISDSTTVGRSVLTATDAAAARTAIGAGTGSSNLVLGTTAGTAAAGNDARLSDARTPTAHTHTAANISDSTTVGRSVLTAADATAARTAISAASNALATDTAAGLTELATVSETVLGTDTTRVITPATLAQGLRLGRANPPKGIPGPTYTPTIEDEGKLLVFNTSGANTFTIPPASSVPFVSGSSLYFTNVTDNPLTISAASNVYLAEPGATLVGGNSITLTKKYGVVRLFKYGGDVWHVIRNDDLPGLATEASSGTVSIATAAEVTAGTIDTKAVTPLKLKTVTNTKVTGTGITEVRSLTQAAYDAIATKNSTTLYVIVG